MQGKLQTYKLQTTTFYEKGHWRRLLVPVSAADARFRYFSADDYTRGYMQSKAMVHHDGRVFWPPPTKFRSTCAVDVTYFPFDDQTCILKLGSWTYNGFQVGTENG